MLTPSQAVKFPGLNLDAFLEQIYMNLNVSYPKFFKMDPQSRLGWVASELLLQDLPVTEYDPASIAIVLSNADGSQDTDQRFEASCKTLASPSLFVYTLPNIVAGEICIRHGIQGENAFFVSPAFDAAMMCSYAELVLSQPHTQACVAGWVNVVAEQHAVFLYLVEKKQRGLGENHSPEVIRKLYS